jgi:carboxymethylenebutenolidase
MCINCSNQSSDLNPKFDQQMSDSASVENKALQDPTISHDSVTFDNAGEPIYGYLARPIDVQSALAVIVTHGNAGLPEDMCNAAAQVAQAGYVGLLLDPTARFPDLSLLTRDFLMSYQYIKLLLSDISAAINYLQQQPFVNPGRVGLMGFCGGGILSIMFAALHPDAVQAVVTFYAAPYVQAGANSVTDPRPDMMTFVPDLKAPLQSHFGAEDAYIPLEQVQAFERELQQRHITAELYVYEGARHGFYHYTEAENYDPAASVLAHERMKTFLKKTCFR